jgi:hypothetical protein
MPVVLSWLGVDGNANSDGWVRLRIPCPRCPSSGNQNRMDLSTHAVAKVTSSAWFPAIAPIFSAWFLGDEPGTTTVSGYLCSECEAKDRRGDCRGS